MGDCLTFFRLGEIADLRGSLAKREVVFFEGGRVVDIPMHSMPLPLTRMLYA